MPSVHRLRGVSGTGPVFLALFALLCAARADAQAPAPVSQSATPSRLLTLSQFFVGGAIGLGLHEGTHVLFDLSFDAGPGLEPVHFGPLPFFAITHRAGVSDRQEFTISSAGFWAQHASSEWLLTRRPGLRRERAPLAKGLLAFNLGASAAYAMAAFARTGPVQRDTRGMAATLRVDERWVGALVLGPAILDGTRYLRPRTPWLVWSSRATKVAMVLLVLRARGHTDPVAALQSAAARIP